jgi:hypothetical protein
MEMTDLYQATPRRESFPNMRMLALHPPAQPGPRPRPDQLAHRGPPSSTLSLAARWTRQCLSKAIVHAVQTIDLTAPATEFEASLRGVVRQQNGGREAMGDFAALQLRHS